MVQKPNHPRAAARAATLLLAASLAACSDAPTGAAPEADTGAHELARQVAAMGFRPDMIVDEGDHVIVEGDIHILKAQLRTVPLLNADDPMRPSFHYRSYNLSTLANVHDVRVDLSGIASMPDVQAAAREAMTHWSAVTASHVRMVEGGPADIVVFAECMSNNLVVASAPMPSGGNVGSYVKVNSCFGGYLGYSERVRNMVHEFGHTLGFRHSNYVQQGESNDAAGFVHINGTPTSGNATGSVMDGGLAGTPWSGFTNDDVYATRTLYPAQMSGSTSYPGGTPSVSWIPVNGAYSYVLYYVKDRYYPGTGAQERVEEYVGSTSGTSLADPYRGYTGMQMCEIRGTVQGGIEEQYGYRVEARWLLPGGAYATTSAWFIPAETGDC